MIWLEAKNTQRRGVECKMLTFDLGRSNPPGYQHSRAARAITERFAAKTQKLRNEAVSAGKTIKCNPLNFSGQKSFTRGIVLFCEVLFNPARMSRARELASMMSVLARTGQHMRETNRLQKRV